LVQRGDPAQRPRATGAGSKMKPQSCGSPGPVCSPFGWCPPSACVFPADSGAPLHEWKQAWNLGFTSLAGLANVVFQFIVPSDYLLRCGSESSVMTNGWL